MSCITRREFLVQSSGTAMSSWLLTSALTKETGSWQRDLTDLERRIPRLLADFHVPGLSIVIIKDAKIAWRRGFGFKDVETKTPVDHNTIFEAGSMSKPVFAYAVMKLCERRIPLSAINERALTPSLESLKPSAPFKPRSVQKLDLIETLG
jgi:CubicO group peptidase (beta-lactamase class C family)